MEYEVVGWPGDGPQLRLDHEQFAYAGKFVMSNTGKAVVRDDGELVAAVAFNADRTDADTIWLRYVTGAGDRRGEGIGARLVRYVVDQLCDRGAQRVRIAVNNPFAYQALYKAGFDFTGDRTGLAELVLERPCGRSGDRSGDHSGSRSQERYQAGLDIFRERDGLSAGERSFLGEHLDADPPTEIALPGQRS